MTIELSFHGAVGGVTGSCHLLRAAGLKILIDCGLFQGEGQWRSKNYSDFGFKPEEIDFLLLTHGHLDHSGRIPVLVKQGFKGKIICTPATHDISKIALMDSAHIQEEDFAIWRKINLRDGFKPKPPLYTSLEAMDALNRFRPIAHYDKPVILNDQVKVTFRDAGHIMGAAFIEVDVKGHSRVIYSGDLGNRHKPVIRDPQYPGQSEIMVVETTYGDRNHRDITESVEELREAIVDTFKRGGNVLIPSFAIERSQELLFILRDLMARDQLPRCSVFLDSPMAISVTEIMRRHPECYDAATAKLLAEGIDPFEVPGALFTRTPAASKQINYIKSNAIIIAGSGMCAGGRIRLHMKHNIWRPECSLIFMGFQASGTLGREIVEGAKQVSILDESYPVHCKVHTIGGFSSHADREILLDWVGANKALKHLFLVHGEKSSTEAFKQGVLAGHLAGEIIIPKEHEVYSL